MIPPKPGARIHLIGIGGTAMPAWRDQLSDEDIWNLINYLRTFSDVAQQ